MWETRFVLTALHRLPSHSSVFTFCFPSLHAFSMTVFKRKIIRKSVLTRLAILITDFFAQYQKCRKYFSSWLFFSEVSYIWITFFLKPKMELISTIIVFVVLEIQSNNVPVDDKPYEDIFQIKLIKHIPVLVWISFSTIWWCDQTVIFFSIPYLITSI